jgi:ATP-binding cassette subfamily C (CFTR/MRP) protein 4
MANLLSRVRLATAKLTDTRLRYMNEIISGMRVIKMYCWEGSFAQRVAQTRRYSLTRLAFRC